MGHAWRMPVRRASPFLILIVLLALAAGWPMAAGHSRIADGPSADPAGWRWVASEQVDDPAGWRWATYDPMGWRWV
jgi:hypothetical protein